MFVWWFNVSTGISLILSITASWNLINQLQQRISTATNWTKWWRSLRLSSRDWSIETGQSFCKTTLYHMSHKQRCSNYRNWTWKLCHSPNSSYLLDLALFSGIRSFLARKDIQFSTSYGKRLLRFHCHSLSKVLYWHKQSLRNCVDNLGVYFD